jgi:conjugative transfer region protein TrbK
MDIKIIARDIAYLALAGALLAVAIALSSRQYPTAEASRTEPSPLASAFDPELTNCQTVGAEAADGAVCKAVGEANRRRFFEPRKLYQDRVTDAVPATPDVTVPAPPWARELPTSAPQSPSTPNSNAPQPPGDIAGHPK